MSSPKAAELVRIRNRFYRTNYRRVLAIVLALLITNIISLMVVSYLVTHRAQPTYFATASNGEIIPLVPLNKPLVSRTALLSWAQLAVTASYTYDFANYRAQLGKISDNFTTGGWDNFLQALEDSNTLNTVQAKQLNVSATPAGTPVIMQQGYIGNIYSWRVQVPIVVAYESASERRTENLLVNVLIKRVSTVTNPAGIGVDQFIVSTAAGPKIV